VGAAALGGPALIMMYIGSMCLILSGGPRPMGAVGGPDVS